MIGGGALVAGLEAGGVEVVFGLPGVHNLAIWRALAASPIRLVGVRHEQAAAYAADGYARATGRVGVALVTTGPGAANTLAATGEAWACGSPIVVVATDIPAALRQPGKHRGVLHEVTDQARFFEPVTKAQLRVSDPTLIEPMMRSALQIAALPPSRPVYLEVPTDLLAAPVPEAKAETTDWEWSVGARTAELEPALELLRSAERPLIWAGGGALRAEAGAAVGALAERLAAPVLTTYQAAGLLGRDHPCDVVLPPFVPEVGALWDEADLVVAVGSDLDGVMTQNWAQPRPPRLLAVNVDADDASKNYEPDMVVVGDARAACEALAAGLPRPDGAGAALRARLDTLRDTAWARLEAADPDAVRFLRSVARALPDEAVVVCDMCIPGYWLGGFYRPPAPRRLLYPLGWGTLGCGFPQAIGAAMGGEPTVSISGDGGFLYACGELATVAQEEIPLTAVVVDDGGYGMLRFDQEQKGDPRFGVDLVTPDFEALARSFGVEAETVDGLGDAFAAALAEHVRSPRPSVLVANASLRPPPSTSPRWYRRS